MRRAPEQQLQIAVAEYLDLVLDGIPWTAINPIPGKSKAIAGLSKAMGLRAGFPDIMILYNERAYFIEMKDLHGTFTDSQREMFPRIRGQKVQIATCRSLAEVDLALDSFGIPHRRVHFQRAA